MSKVKTPQDKKRLSYEHDRRNTYGENHKSSRKNIPRSKRLSHQDECRAVRQVLIGAHRSAEDEVADDAQSPRPDQEAQGLPQIAGHSVRRGRRATAAPAEGQTG